MQYTDSHEWIMLSGNVATVGVTNHAQKELGDVVYVELPALGKSVKKGEGIAVLESTKAAADIYAPLSGKVVKVNQILKEDPSLINRASESEGWMVQIELTDVTEIKKLLSQEQYNQLIS